MEKTEQTSKAHQFDHNKCETRTLNVWGGVKIRIFNSALLICFEIIIANKPNQSSRAECMNIHPTSPLASSLILDCIILETRRRCYCDYIGKT